MKKLYALLTIFMLFNGIAWCQTAVFTESMGSGGSTGATIATWETNNYFDNDGFTFTGTSDMRNTTPSSGYTGSSGTWNVYFNAVNEYLQITGIDASNFTSLTLSFGIKKPSNAETGSNFSVKYSTDGSFWSDLSMPALPTGTGTTIWHLWTCTGTIPTTSTLSLKFTSLIASDFRIDDIKLQGTIASGNNPPSISSINRNPSGTVTSLNSVSISANVTDTDGTITSASLNWGTTSGDLTNPISMTGVDGVYTTVTSIPAQLIGTTVYYEIVATDDDAATTTSSEQSYTVVAPPPPNAPIATAADNISYNSFTSNWTESSGATGYELDVYSGENTELINTSFEGSTSFPAGWTQNSSYVQNDSAGSHTGTNYAGMNATGDYFYTPLISSPTTIVFWVIASTSGASSTTKVQYSSDSSTWYDLTTYTANGSNTGDFTNVFSQKIINASLTGSYYIRWYMSSRSSNSIYFDDIVINSGTQTFILNDQNVGNVNSYNVTGLNPSTTYYYVVRAYNTYGTSASSNEITVTTTAAPANIVIDGEGNQTGATSIVSGGTIPESLQGPDTGVPAVIYTLTATGSNRTVIISKPASFPQVWFCWIAVGTTLYEGTDFTTNAPNCTFTGVNFDAKGEAVVILNDNETLPVELSSFTATISAQNFVNLMWTTQSETGVSGFYIYRGITEEASQAELISPMIAATNTSQQQSYVFTDNQLYNDGTYYYWLQNVDFDGTNAFHGPVLVNYSTGTGGPGTPVIPELTELKGIFPNPFNPTAQISYSLKDAASVSIKVYNSRGQIVRSFDNAPGSVGNHRIVWDGKDAKGMSCSTGVYLVRMFAGKQVFTQKAVLVK